MRVRARVGVRVRIRVIVSASVSVSVRVKGRSLCGENGGKHTVGDIDPDDPVNMPVLVAFESTHAAPQRFRLNDNAPENILSMFVTLDTSHFEMSPLNESAPANM